MLWCEAIGQLFWWDVDGSGNGTQEKHLNSLSHFVHLQRMKVWAGMGSVVSRGGGRKADGGGMWGEESRTRGRCIVGCV